MALIDQTDCYTAHLEHFKQQNGRHTFAETMYFIGSQIRSRNPSQIIIQWLLQNNQLTSTGMEANTPIMNVPTAQLELWAYARALVIYAR